MPNLTLDQEDSVFKTLLTLIKGTNNEKTILDQLQTKMMREYKRKHEVNMKLRLSKLMKIQNGDVLDCGKYHLCWQEQEPLEVIALISHERKHKQNHDSIISNLENKFTQRLELKLGRNSNEMDMRELLVIALTASSITEETLDNCVDIAAATIRKMNEKNSDDDDDSDSSDKNNDVPKFENATKFNQSCVEINDSNQF